MAVSREDWVVIGISGVTCGGKTTLANRLASVLTPVEVFHQDKYFLPDDSPTHVPVVGLAQPHHNYDVLSALDMDAMHRDVLTTLSGRSASHERHTTRAAGRVAHSNKSFLIVEGFTVLNYKPLLELCDLRYYFVLEYGECVARRVFRLYDPPDVAGYFERCVWPEHVEYRAEMQKEPRVKLLDGTRADALEAVLADVKATGATEIV